MHFTNSDFEKKTPLRICIYFFAQDENREFPETKRIQMS